MDHRKFDLNSKERSRLERQGLWGNLDNIHGNPLNHKELFPEIIFKSEVMEQLLSTVYKVARSHSSVLILGESGTGKELIASAIHRLSPRSNKCFMAINCSAIPENLLEAELFGHEKGAFTGADKKRIGHFAAANNGTAFLDEIGDMPLRLQAKLLRVLQEKTFTPIGGRESVSADIRIIAATNINLEKAVKEQNFRLDLYYRLNVLPLNIPPLRERRQDISVLLDHFVEHSNRLHPHSEPGWIDDEAKELLCQYDWPGNIRQLQNLVERLIIINGGGRLGISSLPKEFKTQDEKVVREELPQKVETTEEAIDSNYNRQVIGNNETSPSLPLLNLNQSFCLSKYIEELENSYIIKALNLTKNNKNQAAKLLGLNRTTLVERIKKRKIAI
ncbi:MAG: sigma-54 interaction domain-containing protein [Oligoflexales bacterium]